MITETCVKIISFYKILGSDYVEQSFLYAKNTVDELGADIKLYYNDYNSFYKSKREEIVKSG